MKEKVTKVWGAPKPWPTLAYWLMQYWIFCEYDLNIQIQFNFSKMTSPDKFKFRNTDPIKIQISFLSSETDKNHQKRCFQGSRYVSWEARNIHPAQWMRRIRVSSLKMRAGWRGWGGWGDHDEGKGVWEWKKGERGMSVRERWECGPRNPLMDAFTDYPSSLPFPL